MSTVYDFDAMQINGKSVALSQFKGKAVLVVNGFQKADEEKN